MARKSTKVYLHNGLSGCVTQVKARKTKTLVGLYHGEQSGMEIDPEYPWTTVCEVHSNCVAHASLSLAKSHLSDPTGWCEDCRNTSGVDED